MRKVKGSLTCVWSGLPRHWLVIIGGGAALGLLAGELSAYCLGDPQDARIERRNGARSVVVRGVKSLSFIFSQSDAPSLGSSRQQATKIREGGSWKIAPS
jgi:hypothetical protein